MASVLITLTSAGTGTGPFDLYSNVNGYSSPFEIGISKIALTSGYTSTAVPNGTTIIRVKSTSAQCTNSVDISVTGITTTTTSTTSTTTIPSGGAIRNMTPNRIYAYAIVEVKIGSGSYQSVFDGLIDINPDDTFYFSQTYYNPGTLPVSGNTFKITVYSQTGQPMGITTSNYIQLTSGSSSTPGYFTGTNPLVAESYSSQAQYALAINIH